MAGELGGILAGFGQAAHEHNLNLLEMQTKQNSDIGDMLGRMAESDQFSPEQKKVLFQEALTAKATPYGKKYKGAFDPKTNTVAMPVSVMMPQPPRMTQPPAGPEQNQNLSVPAGAPGAPMGMNVPNIPAPTPPSELTPQPPQQVTMSAMQPQSPETLARLRAPGQLIAGQVTSQIAGETAEAQRQAAARQREEEFSFRYKKAKDAGLNEVQAVQAGLGTGTIAARPFSFPKPQKGAAVAKMFQDAGQPDIDVGTGQPHDPNKWYNVRHTGAALVSSEDTPIWKSPRWALDEDTNHWVQVMEDQHGDSKVQDLGLTPPQGVPQSELTNSVKLVPQSDGSIKAMYFPSTQTRVRGSLPGGTPAPTPPPGNTVPTGSTPTGTSSGATPKPTAAAKIPPVYKPVGIVGGKSLSPAQVINNSQAGEAYKNTIERATEVLDRIEDPKFTFNDFFKRAKLDIVANPNGTAKIIVSNLADLDPDEARFAAAYASLGEDVNVLRKIYGVGASRGPEALKILLNQRGDLLGNPAVFKNLLKNTLQSVVGQSGPIQKILAKNGQPMEITDAVRNAYLRLNGDDPVKAHAALKRDGWIQ